MPIEIALWRVGDKLDRIGFSPLDTESRLEQLLADDISIVGIDLLVVGRQVATSYGKFIDLLALDADGNVVVLELKRDRTPREVVAQLLDYGSWVRDLEDDDITEIFRKYLAKYYPEHTASSLDQAFCERFHVDALPESLNESHELMVVASELDDSTERIIAYLADEYGVAINAVFFRHFKDGKHEYLSRAWLIAPSDIEAKVEKKREKGTWNGEYYVSFGHEEGGTGRNWEDARRHGFISAGGGEWYSRTLNLLEPGGRIWVNVPGYGYVGVGTVIEGPVIADDFRTRDDEGNEILIKDAGLIGDVCNCHDGSPEKCERLVRVDWIKTVPLSEAIREKGFFGNQNSAARPLAKRWNHTVERLKTRLGVTD